VWISFQGGGTVDKKQKRRVRRQKSSGTNTSSLNIFIIKFTIFLLKGMLEGAYGPIGSLRGITFD
jgi:hypothetical protein